MDSPSGSSTAHEESYMPDEWAENESFGELADEKIRAAERIEMDDISWAKLKGSSVKKVAKSREEAIEEAKAFDVSNRSTIVTSSDGANLAIYIKDALSICFKEDPSRDLRTCFEQAVEDLITIYKPPESKDDRRHRATKSAEEDVMLGVVSHLDFRIVAHTIADRRTSITSPFGGRVARPIKILSFQATSNRKRRLRRTQSRLSSDAMLHSRRLLACGWKSSLLKSMSDTISATTDWPKRTSSVPYIRLVAVLSSALLSSSIGS